MVQTNNEEIGNLAKPHRVSLQGNNGDDALEAYRISPRLFRTSLTRKHLGRSFIPLDEKIMVTLFVSPLFKHYDKRKNTLILLLLLCEKDSFN